MKKVILWSIAILALGACTGKINSKNGEPSTGVGNPPVPIGEATVVGNGTIKTISYSNPSLGLRFNYPSSWSAKGDEASAVLSNDSFAPAEKTSRLEFGIYPELVKGRPFTDKEDLHRYLVKTFKKENWNETNLISHPGYWSETFEGNQRRASYYLIDSNKNIIRVNLSAYPDFEGEAVITSVVQQLTIDTDGPEIHALYFLPEQAEPGQSVKLVLIADDEISGVNAASLGGELPHQQPGWRWSRLGYVLPFGNVNNEDYEWGLKNAYPLSKSFRQTSPSRFEYEFMVPENAPDGQIVVKRLFFSDRKGNKSEFNCTLNSGNNLRCTHNLSAKPPRLIVLPSTKPGYFVDNQAPRLNGAYFQKTFVFSDDQTQRLFIRATDNAKLRKSAQITASAFRRGGQNNVDCVRWGSVLHPVKDDLFYLDMDISNCFRMTDSDGTPLEIVRLSYVRLFDEVGNVRECVYNDAAKLECNLEQVQFELKR